MPRLIDADTMREEWLENGENEYVYDTNAVLESIDAQLTVGRWIPVTERLPEAKVDVLAVIHYKDGRTAVNQGWYSALNEQWYIGVAGIHAPVTHWMPLPEPPKEDTE